MDKLQYGSYDSTVTTNLAFDSNNGYVNPSGETETRKQLSYPLGEVRDFVNKTVAVNENDKAIQLQIDSNGYLKYRVNSTDSFGFARADQVWVANSTATSSNSITATTTKGNFVLDNHSVIFLNIAQATSGSAIYLVLDSNDAKPISKTAGSTTAVTSSDIKQNQVLTLYFDGDRYVLVSGGSDAPKSVWYATSSSTGGSATATTDTGDFSLSAGNIVVVKFTSDKSQGKTTAQTLDVDGTGSVNVYGKGYGSYYYGANEAVALVYDGSAFRSLGTEKRMDKLTATISAGNTTLSRMVTVTNSSPMIQVNAYLMGEKIYTSFTDFTYSFSILPSSMVVGSSYTMTLTLNSAQASNVLFVIGGEVLPPFVM